MYIHTYIDTSPMWFVLPATVWRDNNITYHYVYHLPLYGSISIVKRLFFFFLFLNAHVVNTVIILYRGRKNNRRYDKRLPLTLMKWNTFSLFTRYRGRISRILQSSPRCRCPALSDRAPDVRVRTRRTLITHVGTSYSRNAHTPVSFLFHLFF